MRVICKATVIRLSYIYAFFSQLEEAEAQNINWQTNCGPPILAFFVRIVHEGTDIRSYYIRLPHPPYVMPCNFLHLRYFSPLLPANWTIITLMELLILLVRTLKGVPCPLSLLNCFTSRLLLLESGSDWMCAYNCANAASVGFSMFSCAVRSLSTKLNTVVAALLSFNYNNKSTFQLWKITSIIKIFSYPNTSSLHFFV